MMHTLSRVMAPVFESKRPLEPISTSSSAVSGTPVHPSSSRIMSVVASSLPSAAPSPATPTPLTVTKSVIVKCDEIPDFEGFSVQVYENATFADIRTRLMSKYPNIPMPIFSRGAQDFEPGFYASAVTGDFVWRNIPADLKDKIASANQELKNSYPYDNTNDSVRLDSGHTIGYFRDENATDENTTFDYVRRQLMIQFTLSEPPIFMKMGVSHINTSDAQRTDDLFKPNEYNMTLKGLGYAYTWRNAPAEIKQRAKEASTLRQKCFVLHRRLEDMTSIALPIAVPTIVKPQEVKEMEVKLQMYDSKTLISIKYSDTDTFGDIRKKLQEKFQLTTPPMLASNGIFKTEEYKRRVISFKHLLKALYWVNPDHEAIKTKTEAE